MRTSWSNTLSDHGTCSRQHDVELTGECRILAGNGTARALHSLMEPSKMLPFFGGRFFADLESAGTDAEAEASHELST